MARLLLAVWALGAAAAPAAAFELFGYKFFESDNEKLEVLDPVKYTVTLTLTTPDKDLEKQLNDASTLVADEDKPVSGSLGLLSKARNDRKRLVAALYENARYDGLVDIFIEGRDIATLPPDAKFDTSKPVPVAIRIKPGQKFTLGNVAIDTGDVPIDPGDYDLKPGASAASTDVLTEEAKLFRDLRNQGRPFVATTNRQVIADTRTGELNYSVDISPGPPVPFGRTYVDGAKAVDPGFIAYMAGIQPGTTFSPAMLDKARERLLKLGVFSTVTVKEAKAQAADGTLPVQVEVGERKFHYYGVGATYSNTDGAGVSGYWGDRNLFGRAESLRLDASVSRIGATAASDTERQTDELDYAVSAVFKKPGVIGPDSVYIGSIKALTEHPLAYDRKSIAVSSGVEYALTETQTVSASLKGEYEEIGDYLGTRDYLIASVPLVYTFDNRDDKLNPTKGFLAKVTAEPSYEIESGSPYLSARADASTYLSLTESNRFILAGRLAYGSIFGADLQDVPNDRRFYAGGGGSVRGYAYQSIGPYFPNAPSPVTGDEFADTPTGGLSLFEASAEVRIGITDTIQIVPFADAGTVSTDLVPDFSNFKVGVGVGARYITSFGPIRVDVGFPLNPGSRDPSFEVYAGIGQAF